MSTESGARILAANRLFLTQGDVDDIQGLVRRLPPGAVVLDLGAGTGNSALAVYELGTDAHIVTVDIDATNIDWARKNLQAYMKDPGLPRWSHWQGRVDEIDPPNQGWLHHSFDLVLHDAGHEEEDIYGDIHHLQLYVRPGALLWIHDLKVMVGVSDQDYPGVRAAIARLIDEGIIEPTFDPAGIGWIGKFL